jgi:K+-sensing histidine kinase KdpD
LSSTHAGSVASPFRQPKAVFAVAFACVVSFMGIGLVDPILPAISHELHASPSEVTLLFTSYLVVTAVAMLITNWVSSRIGAKKTLIAGPEAAGVLAADHGGVVHVVHTQEEATAGDVAIDGESLDAAEGHILLHAADHGAAGRMVAEYANTVGASTIVVGRATHRGLPALMDDSATHELSRLARSDIMIVSPDAPGRLIAADGYDTAAQAG